jgi:hypothetical protein
VSIWFHSVYLLGLTFEALLFMLFLSNNEDLLYLDIVFVCVCMRAVKAKLLDWKKYFAPLPLRLQERVTATDSGVLQQLARSFITRLPYFLPSNTTICNQICTFLLFAKSELWQTLFSPQLALVWNAVWENNVFRWKFGHERKSKSSKWSNTYTMKPVLAIYSLFIKS